jgi:phosphoserine aminotransferase
MPSQDYTGGTMTKPDIRPQHPEFSSGPCAKRPGWTPANLADAALGRSHRAAIGKAKLKEVIDRSHALLGLPEDYVLGIVPASDTGAVEMALWSLLGPRGIDVFAWESFSSTWLKDITSQLKLEDVRAFEAGYGELPDLYQADPSRDVVFCWNGTTSGVKVPDADWISDDREGLTICDATSAVFAMDMPFEKLDVITWSWQKVMGGEGAHGMIALSPKAVARLESYTPSWPMPKIFQLTKKGKLIDGIFKGETINTPSMLAVEDALDALKWMESIGGTKECIARSKKNLHAVSNWVNSTEWVDFLAKRPESRSSTSICLKIVDDWYQSLSAEDQAAKAKDMVKLLDKEGVAFDIGAYRDAPAGLRLWGGATVEPSDMEALLPWLDWAFAQVKNAEAEAAA